MEEINEFGDFVINNEVTVKQLYELAKENGFEESKLMFSFSKWPIHISTYQVKEFGKGWGKGTAILRLEAEPDETECNGN